ncbi:uncharacterized protein G2W53_012633 [Senna tora]|uniref:Uncharacterized protein n=1 Tax=Senna tora TaxID=362788 RepID=A0A834WNR2_9FABA|nr:uncharacterized protein G2W53_012633 [Senna tora]
MAPPTLLPSMLCVVTSDKPHPRALPRSMVK